MPTAVESGLFTATCTFYDRIGGDVPVVDALGQVDLSDPQAVPGLENIVCMFGVARSSSLFLPDEGYRTQQNFAEIPMYHLLLNGYYPAVLPRFTVQVSGTMYEITPGTVQSDSQKTQTRCKLRRYSQ
jgi:hypothetical protein